MTTKFNTTPTTASILLSFLAREPQSAQLRRQPLTSYSTWKASVMGILIFSTLTKNPKLSSPSRSAATNCCLWPTSSSPSVFVIKVYGIHARSFVHCLWLTSCYNSRVELLPETIVSKMPKILTVWLFREKSWPTPESRFKFTKDIGQRL